MTYWYLPGPETKCRKTPCRMCRVMAMFGRPMGHPCCARVAAKA
jgi:hypothetical protein